MGDRGRRVYDQTTELPLPELIGASDILTEELRRKVCKIALQLSLICLLFVFYLSFISSDIWSSNE